MAFYRDYRGFEIHLKEDEQDAGKSPPRRVSWKVLGSGSERSNGVAESRQEAYLTACASIDEFEAGPHRFPINLVGYPEQPNGDVITGDGEVLGRWRKSGDEALEFVEFIPEFTKNVLFRDHLLGVLCSNIRDWHNGTRRS
jgi:hypothetical protein